ncbi:MAG: phytanoyl-CoA dioxygenase family protein [Pseudomonadota bacterium]
MAISTHKVQTLGESARALQLEEHVLQLELDGLAIVPPEATGVDMASIDRAAELMLADAENITGSAFSLSAGPAEALEWPAPPFGLHLADTKAAGDIGEVTQFQLQSLHSRDRVFRDLIINPVALALVEHTMATQPMLSSSNGFVKWQGEFGYGNNLGLHSDQALVPQPWGAVAFNANATWCLTDYSKEDGALAYVPGSHREFGTPPADAHQRAIAAAAPKGALIVFHGATWHGAYARTNPGMRLTVANYYSHPVIQPQEDLRHGFAPELAADSDNPELLKQVLGLYAPGPYATTDNTERVKYGMGWLPHVKGSEPHAITPLTTKQS